MHPLQRFLGIMMILLSVPAAGWAAGKFYIVGMGTAPDLITVRGVQAIRSADIILLEQPSGFDYWKEFIGDKEVFYCPHGARVGLGLDPGEVKDPDIRAIVERNAKQRREAVDRIKKEVEAGKIVAALEGGDPMIYGTTFYLEMLPKDFPSEIIPGIGALQASSAAVKMSPVFGYDTNSVIVTMDDWPGRKDINEKLMATQTSMIFYSMSLNYPRLFEQLKKHYPPSTPVAVVSFAGDREKQHVMRSTVGRFLPKEAIRTMIKLTRLFHTWPVLLTLTFIGCLPWNCHAAEDGGTVAYPNTSGTLGPAVFSHLSHGARGAGFSCDKCHVHASTGKLTVTMDAIRQGKACGTCHDGKTNGLRVQRTASSVQDCTACHMPSADIVIRLNRMDPVAFSHIRHLGVDSKKRLSKPIGFSCIHCHPEPFERSSKTSIGMEVPHESGACVQCHNGQKRKDGLPSAFAANTRCLTCHKS